MTESTAFGLLKKRLLRLESGEVAEVGPLAALLAGCWHEFGGADSERTPALYRFGQSLRGKPRRLKTCRDRVDNLWGQKRQPQQSSHVTRPDVFALRDFSN